MLSNIHIFIFERFYMTLKLINAPRTEKEINISDVSAT